MDEVIKILMLEDNENDAKIILRLLDRSKLTIISKVVSHRKAFEHDLVSFRPDLILSDHQLPQFSSNEALVICRALYPFIPFILVTGTVSEEFAASIIKAGADDYLLKNNLNRLPTAVTQAIDKKKTEESLKNAHDQRQLDVTALLEKETKLEELNRELETFIYKTYHDLRSPIVSILGIVNIARKEITDEKALHYFSIVDEVTLKQNKMLLNLVRVMTIRDRQMIAEPIEVKSLISETIQGLENMESFNKVKFTLNEDVEGQVLTDRELLFNMMFQLIENSILYRNPEQVESKVSIHIANSDPDQIVLEIADNGIGMPPEIVDKVFDMFYRGTNLSRGSGLGLYLVKNAIEKLNGTITLSSQQNKGSTFVIRFPVQPVVIPPPGQILSQ